MNSSDSKALEVQGGSAKIEAKDAYIVGDYCAGACSGGSTFSVSGTPKADASAVADPYAGRTAPTVSACGSNPTSSSGGGYNGNYKSPFTPMTIYPGVYRGNLTAGLRPGVYIINGDQLSGSGGSSTDPVLSGGSCTTTSKKPYINGTNVTIYIANSRSSQQVTPSSCIGLNASSTATNGQNENIAVWIATAVPSNTSQFTRGPNVAITGAICGPRQEVDYTGSSSAATSCTQIVANQIGFTRAANFQHNCAGTGVSDPLGHHRKGAPIAQPTMTENRHSRLCLRELDASGVSTIEFAFVVTFLCLLAVGLVDFGMGFWEQMQVGNAARAGAEYAAVFGWNQSAIETAATSATGLSSISASASESCGCPDASSGITSATCGAACARGDTAGTYVTVNTSATYSTIITYPGIPSSFNLTSAATVRIK